MVGVRTRSGPRCLGGVKTTNVVVSVLATLGNIDRKINITGTGNIVSCYYAKRNKVALEPVGVAAVSIGIAFVSVAAGGWEGRFITGLQGVANTTVLTLAYVGRRIGVGKGGRGDHGSPVLYIYRIVGAVGAI